ncbi:MAG: hypothetical protein QNJ12_22060 [Ilumatobacter sp.]|uniref:hypothetical protein n=1 Tax=Ilumatobacter sp. TaxID=1967498 RepID=UPI00261C02F4|nr:hypothetical protein [Ilumatobacter sp.]MDJ0771487.1 hypothetical protein [Ilumatobacter sp.]
MADRRPSGLPDEQLARRWKRPPHDFDAEVVEAEILVRNLRRIWVIGSLLVAVLSLAWWISGNGDAALGLVTFFAAPLVLVMLGAETLAFFQRRRTRNRSNFRP